MLLFLIYFTGFLFWIHKAARLTAQDRLSLKATALLILFIALWPLWIWFVVLLVVIGRSR